MNIQSVSSKFSSAFTARKTSKEPEIYYSNYGGGYFVPVHVTPKDTFTRTPKVAKQDYVEPEVTEEEIIDDMIEEECEECEECTCPPERHFSNQGSDYYYPIN